MRPTGAAIVAAVVVVVAGCGNFFPNPDNVARAECEARAEKIVAQKRQDQPGDRVVTVRLDADGGYTIEFADGSSENLIAN